MSLINFPDVPIALGIPNVRRALSGIGARLGIDQALQKYGLLDVLSHQWGIVDSNGQTVISPNVFMSIDYKGDVKSASHPVEPVDKVRGGMGSFANYNKVANPNDITVRMVFSQSDSGSDSIVGFLAGQSSPSRSDALTILAKMRDSTNVYDIATPDASYSSYSLESISYRRDGKSGVSMLTVECRFLEIRQTAEVGYANPATPSAYDTEYYGGIQPETPAAPEKSIIDKAEESIKGMTSEASGLFDRAKSAAEGAISSVSGQISSAVDSISSPLSGAIDSANTVIDGVKGKITDALSDMTGVKSKVTDVLSGLPTLSSLKNIRFGIF